MRLRTGDPAPQTLALVAGVALHDTLSGWADGLRLKWPNDVVAGDAKLAGVLLERHGDAVVIGIGANLIQHPDLPDRRTTSLSALRHRAAVRPAHLAAVRIAPFATMADAGAGGDDGRTAASVDEPAIDPIVVCETLAGRVAGALDRWRTAGLAATIADWGMRAHPVGTALALSLPDGDAIAGTFDGLAPDGALRLRLADGAVRVIHAADVAMIQD